MNDEPADRLYKPFARFGKISMKTIIITAICFCGFLATGCGGTKASDWIAYLRHSSGVEHPLDKVRRAKQEALEAAQEEAERARAEAAQAAYDEAHPWNQPTAAQVAKCRSAWHHYINIMASQECAGDHSCIASYKALSKMQGESQIIEEDCNRPYRIGRHGEVEVK